MDIVTFDEFKKLDIRSATVLEVTEHPDADRLYVLKIDLGTETRQIVAGIRLFYTKEELIGKNIVVITNLEPRAIRGIESNGMLLAVHDESGGVFVVTSDKPVKAGSVVS